MTRYLCSAVLVGALAVPAAAVAQHSRGADTPSQGTATPSAPAPAPSSGGSTSSSGGGSSAGSSGNAPTSPSGRRRGDIPANGTAVSRGSVPGSGGTIVITDGSGFYPWGWGYGYGGAFVGGFGEYYGGYFGAYDPWYGWYPTYAPVSYGRADVTGSLKLKVKPADASVYVDGFYVGIVDDFDGVFQRLHLDRGPHRIEMRAAGHQPLAVDVMIQEDFTITYRGELATQ